MMQISLKLLPGLFSVQEKVMEFWFLEIISIFDTPGVENGCKFLLLIKVIYLACSHFYRKENDENLKKL